jgi:hypothetical protein
MDFRRAANPPQPPPVPRRVLGEYTERIALLQAAPGGQFRDGGDCRSSTTPLCRPNGRPSDIEDSRSRTSMPRDVGPARWSQSRRRGRGRSSASLQLVDCKDTQAFDTAFSQDETPGKQTPAKMKDRFESQVRGLPVLSCLRSFRVLDSVSRVAGSAFCEV